MYTLFCSAQNFGKPAPALVLDAKVCPFYQSQNLVTTVMSITSPNAPKSPADWRRVRGILQDVRVEVDYMRHRSFGIGRFTKKVMTRLMVKTTTCSPSDKELMWCFPLSNADVPNFVSTSIPTFLINIRNAAHQFLI